MAVSKMFDVNAKAYTIKTLIDDLEPYYDVMPRDELILMTKRIFILTMIAMLQGRKVTYPYFGTLFLNYIPNSKCYNIKRGIMHETSVPYFIRFKAHPIFKWLLNPNIYIINRYVKVPWYRMWLDRMVELLYIGKHRTWVENMIPPFRYQEEKEVYDKLRVKPRRRGLYSLR